MRINQCVADMERFKDKVTELLREFEQHFHIFGEKEKDYKVFLPSIHSDFCCSAHQHPS